MRSPRHWLKKRYGEWRIGARREELEKELCEALGQSVTLTLFGDGGNDSIYLAEGGGEKLAVVRLANPFKHDFLRWKGVRKKLRAGQAMKDPCKSLNREWKACQALAGSGVTPHPLWRTSDATAVSYLPGTRMNRLLPTLPTDEWWPWIETTFRALARLHELDTAHLDAKGSNIILDTASRKAYFIDMDRSGTKHGSLPNQQAFDYLKLLSSILQIAPESIHGDNEKWFEILDPIVPPGIRKIDVSQCLTQATIRHLARAGSLRRSLSEIFRGIASGPRSHG